VGGKRALVTGSHGFVGRHFVQRLLADDWEVVGVDELHPGTGGRHHNLWSHMYEGYEPKFTSLILDAREWFSSNTSEFFDLVIHLAAIVGGRKVIEGDPLAVAKDLSIDSDFWRWAVQARPGHVISFSSSAAYPIELQGQEGARFLRESDIVLGGNLGMPDLTYGWVKLTNEYLGQLASSHYGLKVATYRPFSGYGSDQDSSYPFRAICERAFRRETNADGNFFVWGSGLQSRDFVHIDDIVHFVVSTYPRITDGQGVNISSGVLTSFRDLAAMACRMAGWEPKIVGMSNMPEGVHARGGDRTLQDKYLIWDRISLEEGIRHCLDYLEKDAGI
jgi:nucleoside-diphosphate-sugar epimerase